MKKQTTDSSIKKIFGWAATGVGIFLVANAVRKELTKFNLAGKVVLITGGSRGLGLVLARHLARQGAKLAICARSADHLELARQELDAMGAQVITMTVDVTENEEVKAMMRDVIKHYGRLDVLINNAGIIQVGPQELMGIDEYELAMRTNFWAQLYAIQAVIPHFINKGQGRIVNITSIGGKIAVPHLLPYTVSKFAAVGLSEGMYAELKKHSIHVTTVVPNLMRTGSAVNVDVKGQHQKEYALFKHASSNPLITKDPDNVASTIIKAIEYGESEAVLSLSGKVATFVKGVAPGWVSMLMSMTNKLLPEATGDNVTLKGWESESALSHGPVQDIGDRAAARNNEN